MRGITPVNNDSYPSFGINWTKSTGKFLRKIAPRLVEEDGFETAKHAIVNLEKLGKKYDGLTAKIEPHEAYDRISPGFEISVKDKTIPFFVYGEISSSLSLSAENQRKTASLLKEFSEYISGDEFIQTSRKEIEETATYLKTRTLKDKFNDLRNSIGYKIDDCKDWVLDIFSITEVIGVNNKSYIMPTAFYMIAESLPSRLIQTKRQKAQTKELRELIDRIFSNPAQVN